MTPACSCGRPRPLTLPIVAIQPGYGDIPDMILWNCVCKSTRTILWPDATEEERRAARLVDLSRQAGNEMMVGRG